MKQQPNVPSVARVPKSIAFTLEEWAIIQKVKQRLGLNNYTDVQRHALAELARGLGEDSSPFRRA